MGGWVDLRAGLGDMDRLTFLTLRGSNRDSWKLNYTIQNCSFASRFVLQMWSLIRLCGLVVRVLGYRSGGPGSIPGTTRKKVLGLERGPLSLVSTTEELLDRKVAAPV
jgi:hypothetical protein